MDRQNRVILITGCSSGFGYLVSLLFARNKDTVIATMRDPGSDGGIKLTQIAKQEKLSLIVKKLDITKSEEVESIRDFLQINYGTLDVLINNAGFGLLGPIMGFSIGEIQAQFDTNFFGTMRMIQAVTPMMVKAKKGKIITVSSINGLLSFPFFGVYSASKFSLETVCESLRYELEPFNIRVTLVEPGSFLTKFGNNFKSATNINPLQTNINRYNQDFINRYLQTGEFARNSFLKKMLDPQKVARSLYEISLQEHPKLHNIVGYDAHLYYWLHKLIPRFVWEWVILRVMGLAVPSQNQGE